MSVLGVDLSLTCPGFAVLDSNEDALFINSYKMKNKGPDRWHDIARIMKKIMHDHIIKLVVFEGYSYGSRFHREELGEIGGILRYICYSYDTPFGAVAPMTLKKFFTGNGKADKKAMVKEALKRKFQVTDDNQADACALAVYGLTNKFENLKCSWKPLGRVIKF